MSNKQQLRVLIQAQNWEEARKLGKKLCKQNPNDAEAWFLLGAISGQLADWQEAEFCCRQVIDQHADNPVVRFNLGLAQQRQGKAAAAIENYRKALVQKPDFAEAQNELGTALQATRLFAEALSHYEKAITLKPSYAEAHYNLATVLREMGRPDEAFMQVREALRLRPDLALAHVTYGLLLKERGEVDAARAAFNRALTLATDCADAHIQIAVLNAKEGRYGDAITGYRRAAELKPDDAVLWNSLAEVLLERMASQHDIVEAEKCYREATRLAPDIPEFHVNYAVLLYNTGRHDAAMQSYRRAQSLRPGDPRIVAGIATIHEHRGEYAEGIECIHPLIESGTENSSVAVAFSALAPHVGRREEAAALLERLTVQPYPDRDRREMHFRLGNLYEDLHRYDDAFEQYRRAHALSVAKYDQHENERRFDQLIATFDGGNLARWPRARNTSRLPVFIVGMPRSGTSLVEQILASHPQVYGAGELNDLHQIAFLMPQTLGSLQPYPVCMADARQEQLDKIASGHLRRLASLSRNAERVTDKMPHNFLQLGLIDVLFPGARIIHCVRDPIDTCLSIYSLQFISSHAYVEDLAHLGCYYRQYQRLMSHWRKVLRVPMLEVRYEELVEEPERVSRAMLAHLGVSWDERCLQFHETRRTVQTPSYGQVRQPIYKKSVARWKRFEKHLEPLIEALGDAVEKSEG